MRLRLRLHRSRSSAAAVAVGLALALSPGLARAEDEAVVRFERGVQLYEADNFEAALIEFSTAYKLSKNYKLLYNVGICQMATKDYGGAADSFRQYLTEGGSDVSEARRKDVQDRLAKLGLMITRVRVTSNAPAGTTLLIDDRPAAQLPLTEPLTVKTGRRQFSIVVAGRTYTQTKDVTSGDVPTVDLHVDEAAQTVAPVAPEGAGPAISPRDDGPSFPWIPWVVTGALGAGAAITGVLAVGARNDFGESRAQFGTTPAKLEDDRDKAQALGYVTDGFLIGTAIMAGISTYFTVRYASAKRASTSGARSNGRQAADGLVVSPLGFNFSRSF